ncbi:MAG: methylmalonyl Co-A mutase-associated GTPase MeaB [Promethearchaeota archaeon]
MDYSELVKKLLKGETRAAARLITLIENDINIAEKVVNKIYDKTGNAYILGITGAPGSGKSTFINTLTKIFVKQGKKVGIICIDPTSPLTGGAILGDRIRMKEQFNLKNVFIRSMANRGQLGGLSRATEDVIKVLDVYGCDIIIVETVGVGQSEVDIFRSAETVIVLLVPGLGDDIQAIKAGIMEITDIFVVNKMDLSGADRKVSEIMQMLELNVNFKYYSQEIDEDYAKNKQWTPQIIKVNSRTGENFKELLKIIEIHRAFLEETGIIHNYYKNRIKSEALQILRYKLSKKVEGLIYNDEKIDEIIQKVITKELDPYSMSDLIIKLLGIDNK